ncbi:abrin-a-like [Hibiscus syriacus]|uniref:abrin-a-like n=1 Tax=Hibiscus syriacus TaxID=106335 RepID=UPI001924C78E|nr:abrin-a-like [Hibiscus syriacus]
MKVVFYLQNMKVWIAVLAIICACRLSIVDQRRRSGITRIENESTIFTDHSQLSMLGTVVNIIKVKFNTKGATRNSYLMFMKDLFNALTDRADRSGDIPVLPDPLQPNDPRQYVLVELSNGDQTVTLALNVSDVYILGFQAGGSNRSYFFSSVPDDVRNALFPGTERESLPFTERYGSLEAAAGVGDRREIPLGIDELSQHIQNMNIYQPTHDNRGIFERALLVSIQMVSEAVRLRNLQQQIRTVCDPFEDGTYGRYYPDGLMTEYENVWSRISTAIQSATNGIFPTPVHLVYDGIQVLLRTLREVLFTIALMPYKCKRRNNSPQLLASGLGDDDETCETVVAPTSYITGRNGMCVDVYQGRYDDGNSIILWECGQNKANQLWALRSEDNTIRSGGKCLTTYGYSSESYVMIYDCDKAVSDATKWKFLSDGSVLNPKSGLVLTARKDSSGMFSLVVDTDRCSSNQAWYASNNTEPLLTTIVGYKSLCLLASGSQVWLEMCASRYRTTVGNISR